MKKYLKLSFVTFLFTVIFCNCHHNDAGDMYKTFPIQSELETEYLVLDWSALTSEQRQQYKRVSYVIDSQEDFPRENLMGIEKIKSMHINFDNYTLLLSYNLIPGRVEGHKYLWRKNLQEGFFELWMDFKHTDPDEESIENGAESDEDSQSKEKLILTYYCTAVLVNKLPENAEVIFWH